MADVERFCADLVGVAPAIRLAELQVMLEDVVATASAGGNTVPVIARLVRADEEAVRDVVRRFNEIGRLRTPGMLHLAACPARCRLTLSP